MKKRMLALTAALLFVAMTACSGGEQAWNGTFYHKLDDQHVLAFTFERDGTSEDIFGSRMEITTDSGFSRSAAGISIWLTNQNTAEDNSGYRYTLKDDTLTVKHTGNNEIFGIDFSGTYTRGASVEETFDLEDAE